MVVGVSGKWLRSGRTKKEIGKFGVSVMRTRSVHCVKPLASNKKPLVRRLEVLNCSAMHPGTDVSHPLKTRCTQSTLHIWGEAGVKRKRAPFHWMVEAQMKSVQCLA